MDVVANILERVEGVAAALASGELVRRHLEPLAAAIEDMQRRQLFAGKASSGDDIHPFYSEDLKPAGYFNSRESAARYVAWKDEFVHVPVTVAGRNPDAPNLYINGRFHDELAARFTSEGVEIYATSAYSRQIVDKYGRETFGLSAESWAQLFAAEGFVERLRTAIIEQLNG